MKALLISALLLAQPAAAASLQESQLSGIITGEAMCSLARQGAPKAIVREEFDRITQKLVTADLLDLSRFGAEYAQAINQALEACPARPVPDA